MSTSEVEEASEQRQVVVWAFREHGVSELVSVVSLLQTLHLWDDPSEREDEHTAELHPQPSSANHLHLQGKCRTRYTNNSNTTATATLQQQQQ